MTILAEKRGSTLALLYCLEKYQGVLIEIAAHQEGDLLQKPPHEALLNFFLQKTRLPALRARKGL